MHLLKAPPEKENQHRKTLWDFKHAVIATVNWREASLSPAMRVESIVM